MPDLLESISPLGPREAGRRAAFRPQGGKLPRLLSGCGYLEDDLAGRPDHLGRHLNEPPAQGGGLGRHGNHLPADIFLEATKDKKATSMV